MRGPCAQRLLSSRCYLSDEALGRLAHRPVVWRRALVIALLTAILAAVASSDALHGALLGIFAAAERIIAEHPVWGVSLFVLLAALSAMLAFASSAVLVPVALATWGNRLSFLLLWMGWILGGACAYSVARFLGRAVVARLISGAALARYEERISMRSSFSLVLLFQLAVPSEIPGYVLGLARYPVRKYLLALALAELPFAVGTIYVGTGFLERRALLLLSLGAAGALFSLWALRTLHRRLSAGSARL